MLRRAALRPKPALCAAAALAASLHDHRKAEARRSTQAAQLPSALAGNLLKKALQTASQRPTTSCKATTCYHGPTR
jgi:hypothetical protein